MSASPPQSQNLRMDKRRRGQQHVRTATRGWSVLRELYQKQLHGRLRSCVGNRQARLDRRSAEMTLRTRAPASACCSRAEAHNNQNKRVTLQARNKCWALASTERIDRAEHRARDPMPGDSSNNSSNNRGTTKHGGRAVRTPRHFLRLESNPPGMQGGSYSTRWGWPHHSSRIS